MHIAQQHHTGQEGPKGAVRQKQAAPQGRSPACCYMLTMPAFATDLQAC